MIPMPVGERDDVLQSVLHLVHVTQATGDKPCTRVDHELGVRRKAALRDNLVARRVATEMDTVRVTHGD